jgi:hypothetical protein
LLWYEYCTSKSGYHLKDNNVTTPKLMVSQKLERIITPAKAGVFNPLKEQNSRFRRNDEKRSGLTSYEFIKT